ncbi:MAG: helix-turn-helix domain-containing protein [Clostridia bacterium]|nr:helix-turn-helix domain-containing protein [Clostridia bacterium]
MEKIGEKIKILRTKFGLTQKEVADALEIERSTYTYYELGKTTPSWNVVKKLAQIFQIAPYDLLEEQNKYIMSDVLSNEGENINICNLNSSEKKIILALRTLPAQNKNKAIDSIDKIIKDLKK